MNIAIDGPAGAGKSTIAKGVAARMGLLYVDTGALYRAIAYFVAGKGIDVGDPSAVEACLSDCDIRLGHENGAQVVYLNGEDITGRLRAEEIGNMASRVSAQPAVRAKLLSVQRNAAKEHGVVMDGRDIGTVVLPDAELKIYLTASVEVRVKRRFNELAEKNVTENIDIEKIKQDIINRDRQDMTREIAPLKKAEDAVEVDTSDMTIDEVINRIIGLCGRAGGK